MRNVAQALWGLILVLDWISLGRRNVSVLLDGDEYQLESTHLRIRNAEDFDFVNLELLNRWGSPSALLHSIRSGYRLSMLRGDI